MPLVGFCLAGVECVTRDIALERLRAFGWMVLQVARTDLVSVFVVRDADFFERLVRLMPADLVVACVAATTVIAARGHEKT
jgi:hypothetical protein